MTFSSGIQANIRRLTLYAALFLLAGSSIFGQNKFERKIVSETLIAHIPVTLSIPETLAVSPNGRRTAYIAKTSGHFRVVLDGVEQKTYETLGLGPGQFSPDSKSVAYVAGSSGKQFVVADGKELEPYDAILMGTPVFSPDSKHLAYAAKKHGRWYVILDGRERGAYSGIAENSFVFGGDSARLAYQARRDNKWMMVIGNEEQKQHDYVSNFTFSPNSAQHFAYIAANVVGSDKEVFVVIDGLEQKHYEGIADGSLVFSPNGQRLIYWALRNDMLWVVIDGKETKTYDEYVLGTDTFSADNRHVAYGARDKNSSFVVLDGQKGNPRDQIGSGTLVFSPDSGRLAYIAKTNKWHISVSGSEGPGYDRIVLAPVFSPDGKHVAYGACESGEECFVLLDRSEGKRFDKLWKKSLSFDSATRFHYTAMLGDALYLVEETL